MLIVIALGGNLLAKRGENMDMETQRKQIRRVARAICQVAKQHQVVICHGNGPQVGLLALQSEGYEEVPPYPLDVLDAQTQGMIGYIFQQELLNCLISVPVATLVTQVVVDRHDPAFNDPTKPVGPVYKSKESAVKAARKRDFVIALDHGVYRRIVASPMPKDVVEIQTARTLLDQDHVVIFGGGGGIPVIRSKQGRLKGVEAVIDKDRTACLIAQKLAADMLVLLTDVPAVMENYKTDRMRAIKRITPEQLSKMKFAKGMLRPKIDAACEFASQTCESAVIGVLEDLPLLAEGEAGTVVTNDITETEYY